MKNVVIVQKSLVQYRQEFFNLLRNALQKEGIELTLIYGKQNNADGLKNDEVDLEWSKYIPNKTIKIGPLNLLVQPCFREVKRKDLVIVESANKLVLNYLLMLSRPFSRFRFAYWGHGRNLQDNPGSLANRFKSIFIKNCDWWFAYTRGVKSYLVEQGYPEHQITAVQNAIDTQLLQKEYQRLDGLEMEKLKVRLGIQSEKVGIFCGGIYPEKRIDFLLESCLKIKEMVPDFHMIFIGSGIDASKVRAASKHYPWIHYLGPLFGKERVSYFKISALFLMPGLVGLGILDAFALETPLVTTTYEYHSPEIEYLENGKNGYMVPNSTEAYAHAVIELLQTESYKSIRSNCSISAQMYTLEKMVENYKTGILQALAGASTKRMR